MRIFKTLFLVSLLYACGDDSVSITEPTEREVSSCEECTAREICVEAAGWVFERACVPAPSTCTPGAGNCECVVGPCGADGYDACAWREEVLTCACPACRWTSSSAGD